MRYLMYSISYNDRQLAVDEFRKISPKIRAQLADLDYSTAESKCPQKMPIAKLMQQAIRKLDI